MPAYNAERWVGSAIRSAIGQTWPAKELIVIDDGSSDRTLEVARSFESRSVKVLSQENRGASSARNRALSCAQGDYVQWLDADDLLAPDKVELQMMCAVAGEATSPITCAFGMFHHSPQRAVFTRSSLWRDLTPKEWLVSKFRNTDWMMNAAWLISRPLTDSAGPWNEELTLDDDGEYFCRIVSYCDFVKFVPGAAAFYRQWNAGSVSRGTSDKACRSLLTSATLSIAHLRSIEDSAETRDAALAYLQALFTYVYPEKPDLVAQMERLASNLGGRLHPPTLGLKYDLLRRMVGWKAAKRVKAEVAARKLHVVSALSRLQARFIRSGNEL